ncbi:sulfhydryl oxidase 2 isoform X2 [Antechinus flavipes]|uniref:sulfhydryl oxidase 2 isoform X2 n=1 Tax=Antechinus flavipes TaxID=38775 RepID=UPI00223694AA|nr:sulfhydryl oxidase 2 isoform X2 [Antechinus flavipes]
MPPPTGASKMAAVGRWGWGSGGGPRRWSRPRLIWMLLLAFVGSGVGAAGARLYSDGGADAVWALDAGSVRAATGNSSAAWLVQFYSSWCGHCIHYAPVWRALARDVRDWASAIRVAVLDCAAEENYDTCKDYGIHFYPTFRYFKAFTKEFTIGENYKGIDREPQTVRQTMIDFLQNHTQGNRPPACPSLDPVTSSDIYPLLENSGGHYIAILFESNNSYVGREVILDLIQYKNIVVKRALNSDKAFLKKLGVTSIPSCYLIYPNGSHGLINILKPLRSFFSSYLKSLPGVRKKMFSQFPFTVKPNKDDNSEITVWREFDKSKLYMADLESGLHYLLRVELASHKTLEGAELKTFRNFITVIAKLFPGRQPVVKLLETLQEWLVSLPLDKIPYNAILDLVNNKMRISGIFLTNHVKWVGCQGSRPELRGYTCSLWKLFHTLTVQAVVHPRALANTGFEDNPQVVLKIMREYLGTFFGCRECAQHFEEMAKESMDSVKTLDEAVLWLWKTHNIVNNRLAGQPSEDLKFPKVQWPTQDLCPDCHEEIKGLDSWNEVQVLTFLKHHYGIKNILFKYAEDQDETNELEVKRESKGDIILKKPNGQEPNLDLPNILDPKSHILDKLNNRPDREKIEHPYESKIHIETKQSGSFLGTGFSNIDMSLCVLLYVASSVFLMIMYFFSRMRSKWWKVKYYRSPV